MIYYNIYIIYYIHIFNSFWPVESFSRSLALVFFYGPTKWGAQILGTLGGLTHTWMSLRLYPFCPSSQILAPEC